MSSRHVRDHFDDEADRYDALIVRLIPGYAEQHAVVLSAIPFERDAAIRVLDLGCGTGALSGIVLREFPNATVRAIDLAPNMLAEYAARHSAHVGRFDCEVGDLADHDLGGGYDLIASGLAIHHLSDDGKRDLYRRIAAALVPDGVFIQRELILGETAEETERFHAEWREFMARNGEDAERWFSAYLAEDQPASLSANLGWLEEAGLTEVACYWQRANFAVFGGARAAR
jgi:tRNA (cmo5U34)-methyltransferase